MFGISEKDILNDRIITPLKEILSATAVQQGSESGLRPAISASPSHKEVSVAH